MTPAQSEAIQKVKIVRHEMMVIHSTQSLHYIFQMRSVARDYGPKEMIVEMVEYEIFGKTKSIGRVPA